MIKVTAKQMLLALALIVPGHALAEDKAIPDIQSADAAIQQSGDNNSSTIEDKLKAQKTQSTTTTIQTAADNLLAYIKLNADVIAISLAVISIFITVFISLLSSRKYKKILARLESLTAEKTDENREKAQRTIDSAEGQNLGHIASEIAEATKLQISNQYDKAISKWLAIAKLTENDDKETAARAYFSAAYLMGYNDKHKEKDEATVNEVIDLYSKSIGLHQNPDAYNNRGNAKGKKGEHEEAIADFNEAIRLNSNNPEVYYNRGIVKDKMNNPEEAIEDYSKAISLKPNHTNALLNRGLALSKIDKPEYEKAITDYSEAIKLKPDFAKAYNNRGNTKNLMGEHEEAIADYSEAIKLKPDYPEAYNNRGNAKSQMGNFKEAIYDFNEAIRLKPDIPDIHKNRGIARDKMNDLTGAINDFNEAIRLKPDFAEAYIGRGVANTNLGKYDEARADLSKVLELEPENELVKQVVADIEARDKND